MVRGAGKQKVILCDGKRDCGEQGEEEGVKVLGESGASSLGVALGGLDSGKIAKSPEILPGRGPRECKGLLWEDIHFYNIGIISSAIQELSWTRTGKSAPSLKVHQALPNTCPHKRPQDTHKLLSGDPHTFSGFRINWGSWGEGL